MLRPHGGKARARETRCHCDASGSHEPRGRDRFECGRRAPKCDPAASDLWDRGAHGGNVDAGLAAMKIEIRNARVIDPGSGRDEVASLYIADGKIAACGAAPAGFRADETIEARGLIACPGLVDLSARLREPGFEYKATLESEIRVAVGGGI